MAGSQATTASPLICWATQAAACVRVAAAPSALPAPPLDGDPLWPGRGRPLPEVPLLAIIGIAAATSTMAAITKARRTRTRGLARRRAVHSRRVVAMTVPQPGSGGRAWRGSAAPGSAAGRRAVLGWAPAG